MRILAGLAWLMLCSVGTAADDSLEMAGYRAVYEMWNEMCIVYRPGECKDIPAPKLKWYNGPKNSYGRYAGGDTILVNRSIRHTKQAKATIFHEISHYLDAMRGEIVVPGPTRMVCRSEKTAHDLTRQFQQDYLKVKPKYALGQWVTWYNHCRPFANELYPSVYAKPLRTSPLISFFQI